MKKQFFSLALFCAALMTAATATAAKTESLLDSVITKNTSGANVSLTKYAYDIYGNRTLEERYDWDYATNVWIASGKELYVYDAKGNQTLDENYDWDSEKNVWRSYNKYVSTYDTNGNLALKERYYLYQDKTDWENTERYVCAYDANGNLTLEEDYVRNYEIDPWAGSSKSVYAYDAKGNRTLKEYYGFWDYDKNTWNNNLAGRSVYTYDVKGNQTLSVRYIWNGITNTWGNFQKHVCAYDVNGKQTLDENYNWDNVQNIWIVSEVHVYAYDTNGNQTLEEWAGFYKFIYAYDTKNNRTLYESYSWDSSTNNWKLSSSTTYDNYYSNHEVWDIGVEEVVSDPVPEFRYWVSDGVLTVVPATDGAVTVYTSGGIQIAAQTGYAGEALNISLPASGVYIVQTGGKSVKVMID